MPSVVDTLVERMLVAQISGADMLKPALERGGVTFYIGVDPTGPSMHCGHLVPLYLLRALVRQGNTAVVVIGDGTARIGDPSGKNEMRTLINAESIAHNSDAIEMQLRTILERCGVTARFVRNSEWLNSLNYIDFLRDIGSTFSVNKMLTFESFKRRLSQKQGLSFLEFNYMLLQAYDFLVLNQRYGCTLQIGGDDQWGNIVAGIDLIRRKRREEAYALTTPLILNARGEKMGKTADGALFIDAERTSVFDYYQYWRNIDDADVQDMLRRFTELNEEHIIAACASINNAKGQLAFEMTRFAHGDAAAARAQTTAQALFGGATGEHGGIGAPADANTTANKEAMVRARADISDSDVSYVDVLGGIDAVSLFAHTPLCASKAEARRLIQQGGRAD